MPRKPKAQTEEKKNTFVVTQEYFDAHPELEEQGVKVGDEIEVEEETETEKEPEKKESKKAAKGRFAVIQNNQYIRSYDDKDAAEAFASKEGHAGRKVIDESTIVGVTVSFKKPNEKGVEEPQTRDFTLADGSDFLDQAIELAQRYANSSKVVRLG